MALARHLQHAEIEKDSSRQAGQVKWPQSKHRTVKRGHSGRLIINESGYFWFHCRYGEFERSSGEVDPKSTPVRLFLLP
jgi:hypothetical protein